MSMKCHMNFANIRKGAEREGICLWPLFNQCSLNHPFFSQHFHFSTPFLDYSAFAPRQSGNCCLRHVSWDSAGQLDRWRSIPFTKEKHFVLPRAHVFGSFKNIWCLLMREILCACSEAFCPRCQNLKTKDSNPLKDAVIRKPHCESPLLHLLPFAI